MRIACILAGGFEDNEFRVPYDGFRGAGHEVIVIGFEKGKKIDGKRGKETVKADASIDEVMPEQFDALFIPGGYSPDHLRVDPRFVELVKGFADKPIFAVCHGPQILITADLVRGRRMTAWPTIQVDLRYAGADVVDAEVVVDRNFVTSRKPDDLPAFTRAALEMLRGSANTHAPSP